MARFRQHRRQVRVAEAMKRISSRMTRVSKVLFPILWFGVLVAFSAAAIFGKAPVPVAILPPLIIGGFGFFLMKHLVWNLADEVYDCGDYLLVRNNGVEERLALSNVMNVSVATYVNPPRITLQLVEPGNLGPEIVFTPPVFFRINPFARNPIGDDLIWRAYAARMVRR